MICVEHVYVFQQSTLPLFSSHEQTLKGTLPVLLKINRGREVLVSPLGPPQKTHTHARTHARTHIFTVYYVICVWYVDVSFLFSSCTLPLLSVAGELPQPDHSPGEDRHPAPLRAQAGSSHYRLHRTTPTGEGYCQHWLGTGLGP